MVKGAERSGRWRTGFDKKRDLRVSKDFWQAGGPVPLEILFGEVDKGVGDIGVVRDELPVEVGKTEEGVYVFNFGEGRPFGDSVKLDRVHSELTRFDDHPKVFYFVGGELALLKFEI